MIAGWKRVAIIEKPLERNAHKYIHTLTQSTVKLLTDCIVNMTMSLIITRFLLDLITVLSAAVCRFVRVGVIV